MIESLFSKSIDALTEEDIAFYFTKPKSENDKLEFKSYKEFVGNLEKGNKSIKDSEAFKNILTTICAFLNTDGGVLIWGAPEGKIIEGREKQFYGPLCPVSKGFEKDHVINKIVSLINPTPNRILFKAITVNNGGFIYIFEVLASDFAPHQLYGTYYMRLDGQTKFAPHQYVEGLIKRIQTPRLQMHFNFGDVVTISELIILPFNIIVWNSSRQVNEKNVQFSLGSFAHIQQTEEVFTELKDDSKINIEIAKVLHHGNPIRQTYKLVTTLFRGYSRRRIPILATLSGDTAPMVNSHFVIEFLFNDPQNTTYTLLSAKENMYGSDINLEDEMRFAEARLDFGLIDFATSESSENMKKWKPK